MTATAPASHIPAQAARNVREERRGGRTENRFPAVSLEERTAVLETRWEETIPSLATKTDLRDLENRQLKWGIGAGLALLGVFAAVFIANTARMDALDAKLDTSVGKLDAKLEAGMSKLDAKIDALAARQDARMDALDAKINRLDAKIDTRFDALLSRQEKLDAKFDAMMAELRSQRSQ